MLNDYKSQLENEILSGMCFDEDYNVDSNEHFALAPHDVVKIDLRDYLKKIVADIKTARHANYGDVEVDEVTGKVSVKGQPTQSATGNISTNTGGSSDKGSSINSPSSVDGSSKKDVVEFMMMLKKNGALEKLKGLDPEVKKKMADAVLSAIKAPVATPTKPSINPSKQKPLKQPAKQKNKDFDQRDPNAPEQRQMDKDNPEFEESLTLKEAYIILTEGLVDELNVKKGTGKKPVTPPAAPAAPAATPAPAAPATPAPAATAATPPAATPSTPAAPPAAAKPDINATKLADVAQDPAKFGAKPDDPKIAYLKKLEGDYKHISQIPNVENSEVLAAVENVSDQNGTVDVQILQKKSSGADGKSQYGQSGKSFTIPQNTVTRRTPVEQLKKKGLFAKFFGG